MSILPHTSFSSMHGKFSYEYNLYPNNVIEVVYHNKRTNYRKIHRIYFNPDKGVLISSKIIEEAIKLCEVMYSKISSSVVKPNIPIYAIINVLNRNVPGFSYKCKIKKENCPIKIYKYENGRETIVQTSSILEQMYRVFRKYNIQLV